MPNYHTPKKPQNPQKTTKKTTPKNPHWPTKQNLISFQEKDPVSVCNTNTGGLRPQNPKLFICKTTRLQDWVKTFWVQGLWWHRDISFHWEPAAPSEKGVSLLYSCLWKSACDLICTLPLQRLPTSPIEDFDVWTSQKHCWRKRYSRIKDANTLHAFNFKNPM